MQELSKGKMSPIKLIINMRSITELERCQTVKKKLNAWVLKRKKSGKTISLQKFRAKGKKFMEKYDIQKKVKSRNNFLSYLFKKFVQGNDPTISSAKKFIGELTHLLKKKNIKRENIYMMYTSKFTWKALFTQEGEEQIDIQKLKGYPSVILCTNITACHKLSPFYYYDCKTQETLNFKNIPNLCTSKDEIQQVLTDWYNNYFVKLVKEHQQIRNVRDRVLLIIKHSEMLLNPEDTMQNDNFEMLFFPRNIKISQLKNINRVMRNECRKVFKDFCTSYDMNIYITAINNLWATYTSCIESIWTTFLSNFGTKEIIMPTSFVKLTSKLVENVTKEDTALKEISADIEEQLENSNSVGECDENDILSYDAIQYTSEDEGKEYEEQQENYKEITDKHTACFNSPQEIDEGECELESTGSANDDRSAEENIVSSPQTSKLIENVMKEYTALKEISTEIEEQRQNSRDVGEYDENDILLYDEILYLNTSEEGEAKEYEEQQDNDRNYKEIIDKCTEYFNSPQEIDEGECEMKSTGSANNDRSAEENLVSSPLNLYDEKFDNIIELCLNETNLDEESLFSFITNLNASFDK